MLSEKKSRLTVISLVTIVAAFFVFVPGWSAAIGAARPASPAANCAGTSVGFVPLTDMGNTVYHGYTGGLYPKAQNVPPATYLQDGLNHAAHVQPRNGNGQPDPTNGRIVLLSIGMSNTTMEFSVFKQLADADSHKNPKVVVVDGAVGGQDALTIRDPGASYWTTVTQRLTSAGLTGSQVQAVWLKEAIAGENHAFPADAQELQSALQDIVSILKGRYPNLQLIYLASRTYAGYASSTLNPEPYAYQSGFAVKWLIEGRINGGVAGTPAPWLGWGPYLWTDGTRGRNDGLVWLCSDTQSDGTHPSTTGQRKVANLLLKFFTNDSTASSWFLR